MSTQPIPFRVSTTHLPKQGTFTVVGPHGGWRTLRFVEGQTGYFAGKTIVQHLCGSDNEASYRSFANFDGPAVRFWRSQQAGEDIMAALRFLASPNRDRHAAAGLAYALESGRCYRCDRTLTVPASIHRGLGPDCAKKVAA